MKRAANIQLWKSRLSARSTTLMITTTMCFLLANVGHANPYGGGAVEVLGIGNNSCGEYTSQYSDPGWKSDYTNWLGGFITGINYSNGEINDISGGSDSTALLKWIYNYCDENPLENVSMAGHKLIQYMYEAGKYKRTNDTK